tara:strand:+ start:1148 stop:1453 length:306 start_codon:yes stop_codon:yes gene_type:complete
MYSPNYTIKNVRKRKVTVKKKLTEFEAFAKNQPEMPDYTCPYIDDVVDWAHKIIDKMEEIRNANSQLRDNAEYWKESCEEMQEKINEHTELQEKIKKLLSD